MSPHLYFLPPPTSIWLNIHLFSLVNWPYYTSVIGWQKSNKFMSRPVCWFMPSADVTNFCKLPCLKNRFIWLLSIFTLGQRAQLECWVVQIVPLHQLPWCNFQHWQVDLTAGKMTLVHLWRSTVHLKNHNCCSFLETEWVIGSIYFHAFKQFWMSFKFQT